MPFEMGVRSKRASSEICLYGANVNVRKATIGEDEQTLGMSPPGLMAPEARRLSLRGADLVLQESANAPGSIKNAGFDVIVYVLTCCAFL